jgi:hypothetical protein
LTDIDAEEGEEEEQAAGLDAEEEQDAGSELTITETVQ